MGRIPPEVIEQIAQATDVVELIGSYFPLKRSGSTYRSLCPFHQEKTPSFTVNPQRQIFKCFGCGAGGGVFKFVELYENLTFPEAAKRLADRAGIKIVEEYAGPEDDLRHQLRRRLLALHQQASEWFHRNLMKEPAAQHARDYLKKRGITSAVAAAWKIGYAPESWDAFGRWAAEQGFTREEIVESGLVKVKDDEPGAEAGAHAAQSARRGWENDQFYDRFRDRVMFPICNDLGEVIAFSGRILGSEAQSAKYVNSPETMLFVKGNVLFGLHKSKRALIDAGSAVVCEGQLDLITAFEAGIQNVIAPQGTAFTEKQARILKRYVEEVVLCFDADRAGEHAAERSLASLLDNDLHVRVATMPEGHDPDSFIREHGADAFREQIDNAPDFFDFQIERASSAAEFATPHGKTQFARRMAEFVALVSNPILRDSLINNICTRLEVPAQNFREMVGRVKRAPAAADREAGLQGLPKLDPLDHLLCVVALRDAQSRQWLLGQPWRDFFPADSLLGKVLEADVEPDDTSSINAFSARLDSGQQALVSSMMLDKLSEYPFAIARDCWAEAQRRQTSDRLGALLSRLRATNLPEKERISLQKEILDLQEVLTDIARPFPTGVQ